MVKTFSGGMTSLLSKVVSPLLRRNAFPVRRLHTSTHFLSAIDTDFQYVEVPAFLRQQVVAAKTINCPDNVKEVSLEGRKTSDSYAKVVIPLGKDPTSRKRYLTAKGTVRVGKLLEDLDHFAVWLCYLHNREETTKLDSAGTLPRSIVTGCVDRLTMHGEHLLADSDIVFDGHVSWTGRTSMETTIRVFQKDGKNSLKQVMRATFVLVSRDPSLNRAMPVHPLVPSTPEEAAMVHTGEQANIDRKYHYIRSLLKTPPSASEVEVLHNLFVDNLHETSKGGYQMQLKPCQVWMHDTEMRNTHICHPEFVNTYGKIFGGFLMREAIELAFITGRYFSKGPVSLVSIDDIVFREAVKIGDLIQFTARIVYTHKHYMQCRVYAEIYDELFQEKKTTNVFHVTLAAADAHTVNEVIPGDYTSGMLYLSGLRKFEKSRRYLNVD